MDPKVQQILQRYPNVPPQIAEAVASGMLPQWALYLANDMTTTGANAMGGMSPQSGPQPPQADAATMASPNVSNAPGGPNSPMPEGDVPGTAAVNAGPANPASDAADRKQPPGGQSPAQDSGTTNAPNQTAGPPSPAAGPYQTSPQDVTDSRYGYDPSKDNFGSWSSKAAMNSFQDQGLDFGHNDIMAGSPFGRWLMGNKMPAMQGNLMLGALNGGIPSTGGESDWARQQLAQAATGGGFGDLTSAANNISQRGQGHMFDNVNQNTALGSIANDPIAQANAIVGGLYGRTAGWGVQAADRSARNLEQYYTNNPLTTHSYDFANDLLGKLGIH